MTEQWIQKQTQVSYENVVHDKDDILSLWDKNRIFNMYWDDWPSIWNKKLKLCLTAYTKVNSVASDTEIECPENQDDIVEMTL